MESIFLRRPKPLDGECLTSYIQRVAEANFITPNDIWRAFKIGGTRYPQVSASYLLDISPEFIFDIRKFEEMLLLKDHQLENLTFSNALKNFSQSDILIGETNVLNKFYNKYRKFCPLCLDDKLYYKLIWQVQEIEYCPIHNIKLVHKCKNCGHIISSMPAKGILGICPYCQHSILESTFNYNKKDIKTDRIYSDWIYLINKYNSNFNIQDNLTFQQALAFKVLYVTRYNKNIPNRQLCLNLAKGKTNISIYRCIKLILNIIRNANIPIESFISCIPTANFINSILFCKVTPLHEVINLWSIVLLP